MKRVYFSNEAQIKEALRDGVTVYVEDGLYKRSQLVEIRANGMWKTIDPEFGFPTAIVSNKLAVYAEV